MLAGAEVCIFPSFGADFKFRSCHPINTPCAFHVETTWKQSFSRCFNVKYTWCVCRACVYLVIHWVDSPLSEVINSIGVVSCDKKGFLVGIASLCVLK